MSQNSLRHEVSVGIDVSKDFLDVDVAPGARQLLKSLVGKMGALGRRTKG